MDTATLPVAHVGDSAAGAAKAFLERIFPAPRPFAIRLWDGAVLPAAGEAALTLVIARRALRRMFRPPVELSLGEAYLRGDLELEGDLFAAGQVLESGGRAVRGPADVFALARRWLALPKDEAVAVPSGVAPADLHDADRRRERDRAGMRYHYDAGNDFYRLFLDRRMQYSCAYFPQGGEDLDLAQERKLEHVCRKLRLRPGERLLDVGCGWGGLLIHAAERHGIEGVGVTLSGNQHALAQERVRAAGLEGRVDIRLADYRDVAGPFDKVASVGMFEHVGRARLPEYFGHVHRLLRPGGLFLNHGIADRATAPGGPGATIRRALSRRVMGGGEFRRRYVFPVGDLVPVSEANLQAERAGFEVHDVENLRLHYARTLRLWSERLEARRDEAVRAGGVALFRLFRLYFAVAAARFESGQHTVNQTLLGKPDRGRSPVPPSRADLYA